MSEKKKNNALAVYDFTLKAKDITRTDVERELVKFCKTWCFQREVGDSETNYVHYQGRVSLRKGIRECQQILVQPWIHQCSWRKTATKNTRNVHYILKNNGMNHDYKKEIPEEDIESAMSAQLHEELRREHGLDWGPWTEEDFVPPMKIPRQVREIVSLYPWQQTIIDQCNVWDTRTINMVYDPRGNIGKSVLVAYMRAHNLARKLPPVNDYKDVMRMCCDMPESRCYIFDMPRAMKKDKLGSLYTAVEELKSGYCWDDRYRFKERFFDCPNIWVFANTLPDMSLLSADRWRLWQVVDHKLEHYDLKEGEA